MPSLRDTLSGPLKSGSPITTLPDDRLYERRNPISASGDESDEASTDDDEDLPALTGEQEREFLSLAKKRFQTSAEAEDRLRYEMVEDQRFYAGQQWPDQIKADRAVDKRPVITINRLPQFVKQITNPQRQSRPSIQVNPVSDGASVETAEVIQGIIRHIENTSHAEVAYDDAFEDAVIMGRGWFRILTDYVHDGTFEQEIQVKRVPNALAVYPDPAAQEFDYSDARYMFLIEDIPLDEYKEMYGDASVASLEMFSGAGNRSPHWYPEGAVRVAEYWYIEHKKRKLALIAGPSGATMTVPEDAVPEGTKILKTREVMEPVVMWAKINAAEVIERKKWPGRWIPIVPVLGDEVNIDGERGLVGIVRYARDPQRMYNYWIAAETETIALAPRAPYIGVEGQFKGHEASWKQANTRNQPYLEYVPKALDGKPIGPPQRQQYEPPIRAIVEATKQADNDLKSVIGFYDASLGQPGPDQSGRAILARQKQGDTGNLNFMDNLGRSLWHAGRIYLDLMPHVYDTERVMHIIMGDDQQKRVVINRPQPDPTQAMAPPPPGGMPGAGMPPMGGGMPPGAGGAPGGPGMPGMPPQLPPGAPQPPDPAQMMRTTAAAEEVHDIRIGRYEITMSIGPNYQSRRQEAAASMLQLVQAAPNLMPIIGDLLVQEMDWPMARQISERLKKTLPPQLQDNGDDGSPPSVEGLSAKLAAAEQVMQQMKQKLDAAEQIIQTKEIESASKESMVEMQEQTKREIALLQAGAALKMTTETDRISQMVDANNERIMSELADIRAAHGDVTQAHMGAAQDASQTPGDPGGPDGAGATPPSPGPPPGALPGPPPTAGG